MTRGKIYTVYEKPEAAEPTARVELVREGFAVWAFVFGALWLLSRRLWLPAVGYVALSIAVAAASEAAGLSDLSTGFLQFLLQLLLGYHAHDLVRWKLARQGYRFAGVLSGDSEMHVQQRYYEFAA